MKKNVTKIDNILLFNINNEIKMKNCIKKKIIIPRTYYTLKIILASILLNIIKIIKTKTII